MRLQALRRYLLILPLLIWRLEHGQKLLKCQEKPTDNKMQKNPTLLPRFRLFRSRALPVAAS